MTAMLRTRRHRGDEQGSIMVIVMAFVLIIGMVSVAMLNQTGTNLLAAGATVDLNQRVYAGTSGVDYAVQQLRRNPSRCSSGMVQPAAVNGKTVAINCALVSGAPTGANGWAAYVPSASGAAGGILSYDNGSGSPHASQIYGPVYTEGALLRQGNGRTDVLNGDLSVRPVVPSTCPNGSAPPASLTTPSPQALTYVCPAPAATLPSVPLPAYDATWNTTALNPAFTGTSSCRSFKPGRYTAAPSLLAGSFGAPRTNFFESGIYYFDFDGALNLPAFANMVGGWPADGDASEFNMSASCAPARPATGYRTGVLFIFGRGARLTVGNPSLQQSQMELFTLLDPTTGIPLAGLQQVTATAGGYTQSTIVAPATMPTTVPASSSAALFAVPTADLNNAPGISVHGLVYAPNAQVDISMTVNTSLLDLLFGNFLGSGAIRLRGGVVARQLFLGPFANISSGPLTTAVVGPAVPTFRIVSGDGAQGVSDPCSTPTNGAKPVCVTANVTIDNNPKSREAIVKSWTVTNK